MASLLEIALEYVEGRIDEATGVRVYPMGKPVRIFPCVPGGKEPMVRGGYKVASDIPLEVRAWWTTWPKANIGVPMGLNGLVALDVDTKEGKPGLASLQALIEANGALPPTLTAETPSGGIHYVFEGTAIKSSASKLGPALDIRGGGGYICVEPSVVGGKDYKWMVTLPPAPIPAWIGKTLRAIERQEKAAKNRAEGDTTYEKPAEVKRGERRDETWKFGRSLVDPRREVKLTDAEVEAQMRQFDQEVNKPPYAGSPQAYKLEKLIQEVLTVPNRANLETDIPDPDDAIWAAAIQAADEVLTEAENAPDPEPLQPLYAEPLPPGPKPPYSFTPAVDPGHFISRVIQYAAGTTDAALEYHEMGALMLLAAATPNLMIRMLGGSRLRGVGTNLYGIAIGRSTTSHKTSSQTAVRDILAASMFSDSKMPEAMTPEALLEQLSKRAGKASVSFIDEFTQLLTKLGKTQYMEGYKAHLLTLYDRSPIENARRSKREKGGAMQIDVDQVTESHYCLFGLTTPLIFQRVDFEDLMSGFFARFAIVWPQGKPDFRSIVDYQEPDEPLFQDVVSRLNRIYEWNSEPTGNEASGRARYAMFTDEARDLVKTYDFAQQEMLARAEEESDLKSLMFARAVPRLGKVAALIAVGRPEFFASVEPPTSLIVRPDDVEGAIRILTRWEDGARRFAGEIIESKFMRQIRECEDIVSRKGTITRRDLMRIIRNITSTELAAIEKYLGEDGVAKVDIRKNGKSTVWTWLG